MNNYQIAIFITFSIGFIVLTLLQVYNPYMVSYCLDGDDIIDDDLCVTANDNYVDIYPALEKKDDSTIVFIISLVILFLGGLFAFFIAGEEY